MCEPTTLVLLASLAISAVSAVASHDAQTKQVNSQQQAYYAQAVDDANTRGIQMQQVSEAAAQQANERNRAAMAEFAQFSTIAGEYGGGVTAERQAANLAFARASDLSDIGANKDRNLSQLGHEGGAANLRYEAQLSSLSRPSVLGTGLRIAAAGANAYGQYQGPGGQGYRNWVDARADAYNRTRSRGAYDLSQTNRSIGD